MLPLVRYVSHAFVACYQIDCWVFLNYYLFTFAYAGSLWLCTSALPGRVGASLQLRCCSFCGLSWSLGLRSCGVQAPRSRLVGSGVVHTGLVALPHGGSSSIRDPSRGPWIGGWIFNYCPTRRVPKCTSYHCAK